VADTLASAIQNHVSALVESTLSALREMSGMSTIMWQTKNKSGTSILSKPLRKHEGSYGSTIRTEEWRRHG
jgi:hypothetical protein